jgi:hypothetical protein
MTESPGIAAALLLVESAKGAIEEAITLSPEGRGWPELAQVVKALASAGAVDQILTHALGPQIAIGIEVLLPIFAKCMEPDPKTIRRLESKLEVLIESPLRTGIDVFELALRYPTPDKVYRDSRLSDAQRSFDEAYNLMEAQKARQLLGESDWLQAKLRLKLLRAFCAAARTGGYQEALALCQEPVKLIQDAEVQYRKRAADHRREHREALSEADDLQKTTDDFKPDLDTQMKYHLQRDGLEDFSKDPTYHISPVAQYAWLLEEAPALILKLQSRALQEEDWAEMCDSSAEECRGISNLIKGSLIDLSNTRPDHPSSPTQS